MSKKSKNQGNLGQNLLHFDAYTDGSCNNLSPYGEGGSAYILMRDGEIIHESKKGFVGTTNNRMELLAIISAVNSTPEGSHLTIHTDSQYCITVLTSTKRQKKNNDLINLYHSVSSRLTRIEFVWVRGHNGDKYNEYVDGLANEAYQSICRKYGLPKTNIRRHSKP